MRPRDLEGQLEEAVALAEGSAAQRREAEAKLRTAEARLEAAQVPLGFPAHLLCVALGGGQLRMQKRR